MAQEKKQNSFALRVALSEAESNLENFVAALELVNFCEEQIQREWQMAQSFRRWLFIAYRDGAISLWNFLKAVTLVKTIVDSDYALRTEEKVNLSEIDGAIADFYAAFPSFKQVRDSVAHQSELIKEIRNGTLSNFVVSNVSGRTFETTAFGGKKVSYELSKGSAAVITRCFARLMSSFGEPT